MAWLWEGGEAEREAGTHTAPEEMGQKIDGDDRAMGAKAGDESGRGVQLNDQSDSRNHKGN